jgi:hypothetical protein
MQSKEAAEIRVKLAAIGPGLSAVDSLNEAVALVHELEVLDRRIREASQKLRKAQSDFVAWGLGLLREAASSNPDLAAWFAANPGLVTDNVTSVTTDPAGRMVGGPATGVTVELRTDLSNFYRTAHRLLDVIRTVPGFEAIRCREITIVRNKLLEHTDEKEGRGPLWSFGYDMKRGPVLAPVWRGGPPPAHQDEGYFHNSDALLAALRSGFEKPPDEPRSS